MDPKRGRGAVMSLALYTMMILALLALVTFGSRLYAGLTQNRQQNEQVRASLSTLVTALRASDAEGAVSLKEGPEGPALCLRQEDTGSSCTRGGCTSSFALRRSRSIPKAPSSWPTPIGLRPSRRAGCFG